MTGPSPDGRRMTGRARQKGMSNGVGGKPITSEIAFERYAQMETRSLARLMHDLRAEGYAVHYDTLTRWAKRDLWVERSEGIRVLALTEAPATRDIIATRARQSLRNLETLAQTIDDMASAASQMLDQATQGLAEIKIKTIAEAITLATAAAQLAEAAQRIHTAVSTLAPAPDRDVDISECVEGIRDVTPTSPIGRAVGASPTLESALAGFRREAQTIEQ